MASAVAGDVSGIHASGDDSAIVDKHASHRCLVGLQRQAGLQECASVSMTVRRDESEEDPAKDEHQD